MEEKSPYGKILAQWQIPEYQKYKRTFTWYLIMSLLGLGLLIYAAWTLNFLFALIIIISATIIFLHERREPDMLNFQIVDSGIVLADKFTPFKEIEKFWIIYEPPEVKNLYFKVNRFLRAEISVPLIRMNPLYVRKMLLKYLREDLHAKDESGEDIAGRILKI
jgi:hypothetical protein